MDLARVAATSESGRNALEGERDRHRIQRAAEYNRTFLNMPPGAPGSSFSFNLADTFGCGEQI